MLHKTIILVLISLSPLCFSQSLPEPSFHNIAKPKESGEKISVETDRQFYCVQEKIYFAVRYKFNYPIQDVNWSNVIYVELIRWNGEKIAQAKFKLYENSASGFLTIPNTLLSGNYYLRAYTKWMRNFAVEDYFYKLIKVINPFESRIDGGPNQDLDQPLVQLKPAKGDSYNGIECFTDKSIYKQREKVELTLLLDNHANDNSDFCVSVAKAAHVDTNNYFIWIPDKISPDERSLVYLPEIRGISVSGKILPSNTPVNTANTTVHLSTPQNWKYYSTFQTQDKGFFCFTLPDFFGQNDFYIDAVLENGESAEIVVDNDYCNRGIHLAYIPFSLDSAEAEIALEMAVNMQLSSIYNENDEFHATESEQLPFYVRPKKVYYTEQYIRLPNLEEFFYELVHEVRTTRIRRQAYLKLVAYSQYPDLLPLVLLDNVPVPDVDEFLRIPLDRIETVEIVDEPYIVSGKMYSGIICISTTRKDFAGIELPENSLFFSYDLLSGGYFSRADFNSENSNKDTYRHNLLFWDPGIELVQNQTKTLSFYTSDSKGEYTVSIRSINPNSEPQLFGTCKIVVK